jgi:hypothetical protein
MKSSKFLPHLVVMIIQYLPLHQHVTRHKVMIW